MPFACQNLRVLMGSNGESTVYRHGPEHSSTAGQYRSGNQRTQASQAERATSAAITNRGVFADSSPPLPPIYADLTSTE